MTLIEEVRAVSDRSANEEILLLETIKKPILNRTQDGHRYYDLTSSTLDYIFRTALGESILAEDPIGTRRFFDLLRKLNKVLLAEGFIIEAKLEPYMDIYFIIRW